MEDLGGLTVAITGASRGLGAALAEAFAERGARLSLCARSPDALHAVEDRVRELGADCLARPVDVAIPTEVERWVEETAQRLAPPDVLVNNASVLGPRTSLASYPMEEWSRVLAVNLTGAFAASRAVLPHMLSRGRGSIINVSSGAAVPPRVNWGAYAVSKQALEGLTRNMAEELKGTGVRVNTVDPGAMRTRMRAEAYPQEDPDTVKTPVEIAELFLWLASDASRAVTGERFRADDWRREP